jgi:hypothetical protein
MMARLVYGRLVASDDATVTYEYAVDQAENWVGPVVIDRLDPANWRVDDPDHPSQSAAAIAFKARRGFEITGAWPRRVTYFA